VAHVVRKLSKRWQNQWQVLIALAMSVALGVGANLAILDSVYQMLRERPAGIDRSPTFVRLRTEKPIASGGGRQSVVMSFPAFEELRSDTVALASSLAYQTKAVDVEAGDRVVRLRAALVTDSYFSALGVRPMLGMPSGVDWSEGGVAISRRVWRDLLRDTPHPLGQTIRVSDRKLTVVAVLPAEFVGLDYERVDVWAPLAALPSSRRQDWRTDKGNAFLHVVGRIDGGLSPQLAQSLTAHLARLMNGDPRQTPRVVVEPLSRAEGVTHRRLAALAWVLIAVSVLLLAVTAANATAALFSRVLRNEREFAVRLALGAEARDVLAVLALDALPVVLVGGIAGVLGAAFAGSRLRAAAMPTLAWSDSISLAHLAPLAVLLGGGCLAAFVLVPWLQTRRINLLSVLNAGAFGSTGRLSVSRSVLTALQFAASICLIIGALLFIRTYTRLSGERLGFDAGHVAVVDFGHITDSIPPGVVGERLARLATKLRSLPGVVDAGVATGIPLRQSGATSMTVPRRGKIAPNAEGGPYVDALDAHGLVSLSVQVVRGRLLSERDVRGAQPVAIVNETMAAAIGGSDSALGACLLLDGVGERTCRTVVGIVRDVQRDNVLEGKTLQTFVPIDQAPDFLNPRAVFVRTDDPGALRPLLRRFVAGSDLGSTSYQYDPYIAILEPELMTWRIGGFILVIYGAISILVAGSGVVATISFLLAQRRRELAIRRALGAPFGSLVADIGGALSKDCVIGSASAIAIAVLIWTQWTTTLFIGTTKTDLLIACSVALFLLASVAIYGILGGSITVWRSETTSALRS